MDTVTTMNCDDGSMGVYIYIKFFKMNALSIYSLLCASYILIKMSLKTKHLKKLCLYLNSKILSKRIRSVC